MLERLGLHVREAKGRKDRLTVVPEVLMDELAWIAGARDREAPLMPAAHGGPWTVRSVERVVARAG